MVDCFVKVARQEGHLAFYRGLLPSLVRQLFCRPHLAGSAAQRLASQAEVVYMQLGILPYAGVDIAAFEIFKEQLLDTYDNQPPPILILGAGMVSSSIAQFASYPLALVRTRLQVSCQQPASLVESWDRVHGTDWCASRRKATVTSQ